MIFTQKEAKETKSVLRFLRWLLFNPSVAFRPANCDATMEDAISRLRPTALVFP
jgi:hypothetical protein